MTHAELARLGGVEGAEVIMWLVMRGALSAQVRCLHRAYTLPSMTGIATAIHEDLAGEPSPSEPSASASMERELKGVERRAAAIRSRSSAAWAYRLNHFLHSLIDPNVRKAFR